MNAAAQKIVRDLEMPIAKGRTGQDWEMMLNPQLYTRHWFNKYARAYRSPDYGQEERAVLFDLMLLAVDYMLAREHRGARPAWRIVTEFIRARRDEHKTALFHWLNYGGSLDDSLPLAAWARSVWTEVYGPIVDIYKDA